MKKNKFKFIILLSFIIFLIIISFSYISSTLGNKDSNLAQNLKRFIPIEVKKFLKKNRLLSFKMIINEKEKEIIKKK